MSLQNQRLILFIDDLASNLMAVQLMLETEDFIVQTESSGQKALDWLESSQQIPSLILLDVMMPVHSGFEICRILKSNPLYKNIPVIFVTAKITQNDILEGFNAGGVDYVTKPFNNLELLARVNNHIELSENRKKLEEQNIELEEANRIKTVLFEVIAHDVRSPISGFMSMTEMMYKQPSHFSIETVKQSSSEMFQSSQRLYQMVENLLNWGKLQLNGFEIIPAQINVRSKIIATIELFKTIAIKKKIKFSVSVTSILELQADEEMFATILRNIVLNALKYSNESSTITIIGGKINDSTVTISVRDEGIGMSEEVQENLRKKVFVSNKLETTQDLGMGIGLSLIQNFIELHNGNFQFTSEKDKGTTITITFPIELKQLTKAAI